MGATKKLPDRPQARVQARVLGRVHPVRLLLLLLRPHKATAVPDVAPEAVRMREPAVRQVLTLQQASA
ncbi:MAG: hypothetical protein ABR508_12905, partial [Candidatus Baltobacteraceae bacterium]